MELPGLLFGVLFWLVLAIWGLLKKGGLTASVLGLLVAALFLLGPAGEVGVVDLKSYWYHQYLQPGLTMFIISAGTLGLRLWWLGRRKLAAGPLRVRRLYHGATVGMVIGVPLIILAAGGTRYETVRDRVRKAGRITDSDAKQLLLIAARDYLSYGPAEGKYADLRFAPGLCRSPGGATGRISESGQSTPHGEKLYVIYARAQETYIELNYLNYQKMWQEIDPKMTVSTPTGDAADDQVIVKESWTPLPQNRTTRFGQGIRPAERNGQYFWPGDRRDLFIMLNIGRQVAGTDNGWVYGTVTPDRKTVTSSGQVAGCMKCHTEAPYGRLFGLPVEESRRESPTTAPAATRATTPQ